jgi:hypothetical protein
VENVWKNRGSVVERPTVTTFFSQFSCKSAAVHFVDAPSMVLSLDRRGDDATLQRAVRLSTDNLSTISPVNVHRFEEVINGREFKIEVSAVGPDKWRAQIARVPGGSAATMPFYGKTPHEAAGQLSRWLSLAHGTARPQL